LGSYTAPQLIFMKQPTLLFTLLLFILPLQAQEDLTYSFALPRHIAETTLTLAPNEDGKWVLETKWKSELPTLDFLLYFPGQKEPATAFTAREGASEITFSIPESPLTDQGAFRLKIKETARGQSAKGTITLRPYIEPDSLPEAELLTSDQVSEIEMASSPKELPPGLAILPNGSVRYTREDGSYQELQPNGTLVIYDGPSGKKGTRASFDLSPNPPSSKTSPLSPEEKKWLDGLAARLLLQIEDELGPHSESWTAYDTYERSKPRDIYALIDCRTDFLHRLRKLSP